MLATTKSHNHLSIHALSTPRIRQGRRDPGADPN